MANAEIIIIGGGIVGANLAYQLAVRGTTNITVLERDHVASGSTGRATGGLRQQFAGELDIRFASAGVHFYEQFIQEHAATPPPNQPPRFYQYGYLFLCTTPESWQAMQQYVALQRSLGVPTRLLSPAEVRQRVPQVIVEDVLGATFCPTDGYSDPGTMTRALFHQAQALGVTIREQSPVTGITVEHGRVQAVQTPQETYNTPLVINATGAYAALVARLAGINDLPQDTPMVVDLNTGFHFRRRDSAVVIAMPLPTGREDEQRNQALAPEAFTLPVDTQFWSQVQAVARRRCPPLADAHIVHTWSGLYEMTPDQHPILGTTEIEGFLCACGFSGHGFMHSPMAAKLLTELILDGASSTLDIGQFSIERFRNGKLLPYTPLL